MSYTVHYYHRKNKKRYTVTQLVTVIKIDGSLDRLYRSCQLSIVAKQGVPYENGECIRVSADGKLLFDGRVFHVEHSATSGVTLTCYDNAYYFERNTANLLVRPIGTTPSDKGLTLSEIVQNFAKRAGVPTGYIKPTAKRHGNIGYMAVDMQTMLQGLLGLERRKTGKRYYLRMNGHKLDLRERGGLPGLIIDPGIALDITKTDDAQNVYTVLYAKGPAEAASSGVTQSPGGFGGIASSKYKGPDSNGYQSGFKSRLKAVDRWDALIYQVANKNGVDPLLLKLIVMMESSGNPDAISSDGAGSIGLTQITPGNVGLPVDANRLRDPEYNLQKACEIMKGSKYGVMKRQGYAPSSKNMAHLWNGWPVGQGVDESGYANTIEQLYRGYGMDADRAFTDSLPTESNDDTATPKPEEVVYQAEASNKALRDKLGTMRNVITLDAESAKDLAEQTQRIVNSYGEDRNLSVEMIGHVNGQSGRKVELRGNQVSGGTWYISADSHTITANGHTMRLTLSLNDNLPEPEVPETPKGSLPESEVDPNAPERADGKIFIRPTDGRVTQSWGPASGAYGYTFHNGIDIANDIGTSVRAAAAGRVSKSAFSGGYGKHVMITHFPDGASGQKWVTVYAHLSDINVKVGDLVGIGQLIGKMGSTGNSTGSHLHFEIHKGDYRYSPSSPLNTVNPALYY